MRRVQVRVWDGGRVTARCCFREPYCGSGWWVVVLLGCRFGLCRGRRMVPWGQRAGCRWSLGTGAPGGDVHVGAHGAEGSLGPGAGGVGWGSGTYLCRRAVGRCVCGAPGWLDMRAVVRVGLGVGPCQGCWLVAACGRVGWCLGLWTRVAGGAQALARLWGHGAEGLLGPPACGCRIRVAGHVSPPGRWSLVLPDCCGCVVLRLVSLRRPFGCTFLPGALWRAGP